VRSNSEIASSVEAFIGKAGSDLLTQEEADRAKELACILKKVEQRKNAAERNTPRMVSGVVSDIARRAEQGATESPIEEILLLALNARSMTAGVVATQVEIGPYRVDLAIHRAKLAIECDGRDYHTSPAQITKDQQRDDYLRRLGWTVIRFTGQEIRRNLYGCVDRVTLLHESLLRIKGAIEPWEGERE